MTTLIILHEPIGYGEFVWSFGLYGQTLTSEDTILEVCKGKMTTFNGNGERLLEFANSNLRTGKVFWEIGTSPKDREDWDMIREEWDGEEEFGRYMDRKHPQILLSFFLRWLAKKENKDVLGIKIGSPGEESMHYLFDKGAKMQTMKKDDLIKCLYGKIGYVDKERKENDPFKDAPISEEKPKQLMMT